MIIDGVEYNDTILMRLEKAQMALDRLIYHKIEGNVTDEEWDATKLIIEYNLKDNVYRVAIDFNKDVSEESREIINKMLKEVGINMDTTNGYAVTNITEKTLDGFVGLMKLDNKE